LLSGLSAAAFAGGARAQSALAPSPPAAPLPSPQAPKLDDTVDPRFRRLVIARWGDALLPAASPFNPYPLTLDQASSQFPYDAVIAGLITPPPADDGIPRLVMVLANPTAPARMVFPGGIDKPAVAGALQGASVLNLEYLSGRWVIIEGGYQSRRLDDGTLCKITGPVAAGIGGTVQGLLGPQGGCATPWGTVLLAEGDAAPWLTRLAGAGFGFADPADAPRFGWIAEFNPLDPQDIPAKRTALGRLPRAGVVAATAADGRPVVFFSQDAPSGFLFRFIAATAATDGTALDLGTISVAQNRVDGIAWVDLGSDIPALAGTLSAAAAAGGSLFNGPGGLALAPGNAALYLAYRGNPSGGGVLAFTPPGGDLTAKNFAVRKILAAGETGSGAWLLGPRTLSIAADGALWIGTDQQGEVSATADGLFTLAPGAALGVPYLAPIGAALGGCAFDAATHTIFAAVRHPGATSSASFDNPATRWPTLNPSLPPQTTLIALSPA
jgi:secreted PhoX family phosphatase